MKFATSPPTYSLKSATTSEWSQTCNPSQVRLLPELPRSRRMAPAWTLLQMASGVADISVHSWMSAFLIPTPSPTVALPSRPVIVCMKTLKSEHMSSAPLRWSSFFHSTSLLCLWWSGQGGYLLLQASRFPSG